MVVLGSALGGGGALEGEGSGINRKILPLHHDFMFSQPLWRIVHSRDS